MTEFLKSIPFDYEPKRQNRFFVKFPDEFGIELWKVQRINKPTLFGTTAWAYIEIGFLDPIGPSTSQQLYAVIKSLEKIKKGDNKTLFEFHIQSLDPTGVVVEDWLIKVEEVISIDFGYCNMDSDEMQEIIMVVQPYDCILLY